jgi:hypothetical protein
LRRPKLSTRKFSTWKEEEEEEEEWWWWCRVVSC